MRWDDRSLHNVKFQKCNYGSTASTEVWFNILVLLTNTNGRSTFKINNFMCNAPSLLPSLSIIWAELIIFRHLGVIVDIDHIYRPVSVTDEEDGVIIRLQHLKKVDICAAVDENKVPELGNTTHQNNTFSLQWRRSKSQQFFPVYPSVIQCSFCHV